MLEKALWFTTCFPLSAKRTPGIYYLPINWKPWETCGNKFIVQFRCFALKREIRFHNVLSIVFIQFSSSKHWLNRKWKAEVFTYVLLKFDVKFVFELFFFPPVFSGHFAIPRG